VPLTRSKDQVVDNKEMHVRGVPTGKHVCVRESIIKNANDGLFAGARPLKADLELGDPRADGLRVTQAEFKAMSADDERRPYLVQMPFGPLTPKSYYIDLTASVLGKINCAVDKREENVRMSKDGMMETTRLVHAREELLMIYNATAGGYSHFPNGCNSLH
jgi:hypothetical protein